MRHQKKIIVFFMAILLILTGTAVARVDPTYVIINCRITPVSGPPVENGVIIIRNGLIESIGPKEKIPIPEDAEVINAEGMNAYPGLIDAHTNFLFEAPKEEPQRQRGLETVAQEESANWNQAKTLAFDILKPKKTVIEGYHKSGVLTVLAVLGKEIFAGQSVILNINGEKPEPMVIQNPFGLHINFTTVGRSYPSSLMGTMALLRQSFLDANHYELYRSLFLKSSKGMKRPEYDPFLEALLPFIVEKKPVIFNCANLEDIKRAIGLIKEFKLNGFLSGANEAWRVADFVKKAKLPLLVSLKFTPPLPSQYALQGEELKSKAEKEIYPANAANLYKEGIKFALVSNGISKPEDILKFVREAIKAGLPREEALSAMTITPAKFLGISHLVGSIEPGKIANIMLTSGEVFEEKTIVKRVFVDGLSFEVKEAPKDAKPSAVNISGKWKVQVSGPMGEMEMTAEFEQSGSQVDGFFSSDMGKMEISDGVLSGNEFTFTLSATIMGESVEMSFNGKVEKDSLEGTISFMGGSAELKATRIPERIF